MTITPIETIKREAEEAAANGKTANDACRFPFDSAEGQKWTEFYAGASFQHALAEYRSAIGESSSIR